MRALAPVVVALLVFLGLGAWFLFREPKAAPPGDESSEPASPRFPVEDRSAVSASVARLLADETIAAVDDLRETIAKGRTDSAGFESRVEARLARVEKSVEERLRPQRQTDESTIDPKSLAEMEKLYVFYDVTRMRVRLREILADPASLEAEIGDRYAAASALNRLRDAERDLARIRSVDALVEFRTKNPELR